MAFDVDVGVVSVGVVCYVGGCTGLQLVFDILVYFLIFLWGLRYTSDRSLKFSLLLPLLIRKCFSLSVYDPLICLIHLLVHGAFVFAEKNTTSTL